MNNTNTIPNIQIFLEKIDSDKTFDHEAAALQITSVVLSKTLEKTKSTLTPEQNTDIDRILIATDPEMPTTVFDYLKKIGKFDEFTKILDETTNEVRNDYIRTHLKALSEEKRASLFTEFPGLKMLFMSTNL